MVVATASSPRNRPGGGTAITVDGDLPSLARGPGWAPFYGQMSKMSEPIDMPDIGGLIRPAPDEARGDRECAVRGPQCAGGLDSKLSEPLQLIKDSGCHVHLALDAHPIAGRYVTSRGSVLYEAHTW